MKTLEQTDHYQPNRAVEKHQVTSEFAIIYKIFKLLPKNLRVLDIACAEGFLVWMARKAGIKRTEGIEIDPNRVHRGEEKLNIKLINNDIFDYLDVVRNYDVFILSRFLHNITEHKAKLLVGDIDEKKDYLLIIKYKPGLRKENYEPREPLATKKGINKFLERYSLAKKSFSQEVIVAAKGKFVPILKKLRERIGEG
ncbi:MAG: class I SAM-dependent methyltransferase [bacterium]|nr:class I SAM-dependent methyltransferase [bacterium]